jgi:hypothetical protein
LAIGIARTPRRWCSRALHAQDEVAVGGFDAARTQFHVLGAQRAFHVAGGQSARGQLVAVQPDPHRIALAAAQAHLRHAFQAGEAVDQVALGVVGQLHRSMLVERRLSQMIGSESLSTLLISGGSASSGMRSATRLTALRTSLAAASMSRVAS